ncbi:hypothetical protein CI109_107029 [Kwoniella shandongensis]|uniref:Uncharacterized protein n=1 Tax=Kwoniella shandongensis TaxID=1734106 RepID=A0A5M6BNG2_9TREE|nr:uncharacterized protein CI109_007439 [Kwoniella shandongensis]KAA5524227.1 hypothetical protein CI109_007439 [Kwoniella shandongensis]
MAFLGPTLFPRILMHIIRLWFVVALGCLIMVLIVWIMIFIENTKTFSDTMHHYLGNDQNVYDSFDYDHNAGYVSNTNIPKHLGGVVFTSLFDVAMWFFVLIAMASDLFWRFPICKDFLETFWTSGLYDTRGFVDIEFFFIFANAFLKLFIVAATGSQTYVGIYPNNEHVDTPLFCLYATMCLAGSIPFTNLDRQPSTLSTEVPPTFDLASSEGTP